MMPANMLRMGWVAMVAGGVLLSSGCVGLRQMDGRLLPSDVKLTRQDVVVIKPVAGESKEVGILLGIIKIIDDSKVEVLGICFFKDQTARLPGMRGYLPGNNQVESRAYYKALAAAPDADGIIERSVTWEKKGALLWWSKKATLQGQAIKLKPD